MASAGKTRTVAATLLSGHVSQMSACFVCGGRNFVVWTQKMFLINFRNISCVRAARNDVAAFWREAATSEDTMLPPQCARVFPGPNSIRAEYIYQPEVGLIRGLTVALVSTLSIVSGIQLLFPKYCISLFIMYVLRRKSNTDMSSSR